MHPEAEELLKHFLRKWSTIQQTEAARALLEQDVENVRIVLDYHDVDQTILDDALEDKDRQWFAKKFRELTD